MFHWNLNSSQEIIGMGNFFLVRGKFTQRIKYSFSNLVDGLVGLITLGYIGSNFNSKHIFKQAKKDIRNNV